MAKFRVKYLGSNDVPVDLIKPILDEIDAELAIARPTNDAEVIEMGRDADGIIMHGAVPFTKEIISQLKKTKVVCRTGVGVDRMDLAAAEDYGINSLQRRRLQLHRSFRAGHRLAHRDFAQAHAHEPVRARRQMEAPHRGAAPLSRPRLPHHGMHPGHRRPWTCGQASRAPRAGHETERADLRSLSRSESRGRHGRQDGFFR